MEYQFRATLRNWETCVMHVLKTLIEMISVRKFPELTCSQRIHTLAAMKNLPNTPSSSRHTRLCPKQSKRCRPISTSDSQTMISGWASSPKSIMRFPCTLDVISCSSTTMCRISWRLETGHSAIFAVWIWEMTIHQVCVEKIGTIERSGWSAQRTSNG